MINKLILGMIFLLTFGVLIVAIISGILHSN